MKKKILFIVSLLTGLMMVFAGLSKILPFLSMPALTGKGAAFMAALSATGWMLPLIGVVEIIGGVLLVPGRYRALGAVVLFPVMTGILFTNLFFNLSSLAMAIVFFAINVWLIIENREKYMPMIRD